MNITTEAIGSVADKGLSLSGVVLNFVRNWFLRFKDLAYSVAGIIWPGKEDLVLLGIFTILGFIFYRKYHTLSESAYWVFLFVLIGLVLVIVNGF